MNLSDAYNAAIAQGDIDDDFQQRQVLSHLQRLVDALKEKKSFCLPWVKKKRIKGIYVSGPVGAGKTYLVDLFYEHLEGVNKGRFHFHHFMQQIDVQLRRIQGQKDPLRKIAQEIAKHTRVLCFDEFLVHDVAYAMILAELLQALDEAGVILVISSNTKPDDLYLNGVQRDRFLPAIDIIKRHCEVLLLHEKRDYRLGRAPLLEAYLHPLNAQTAQLMEKQFAQSLGPIEGPGMISIQHRDIPFIRKNKQSIWFDFHVLCHFPRSQLDYLELASQFDNVFVSGIPRLTEHHTVQTIMFIHLIDVLYDRGVNLILSAEVPLDALYVEGEMKEPFKRTLSRLTEMQSMDYQSRHPKREVKDIV